MYVALLSVCACTCISYRVYKAKIVSYYNYENFIFSVFASTLDLQDMHVWANSVEQDKLL